MTDLIKIFTNGNGEIDWRIIAMVIIAITIIEVVALIMGVNGKLMSFVLMILAGLGGLIIPNPIKIKRNKGE